MNDLMSNFAPKSNTVDKQICEQILEGNTFAQTDFNYRLTNVNEFLTLMKAKGKISKIKVAELDAIAEVDDPESNRQITSTLLNTRYSVNDDA
jgi:hypothetical protein